MKNPFQYGGVVEGAAFCNRKKELANLTAVVESRDPPESPPNPLPFCELFFAHSVRWGVASIAGPPWSRHSTAQHDQRKIRVPLQAFTGITKIAESRSHFI